MHDRPSIFVVIPAHNEEKSIHLVIADIPKEAKEVVVVDNASTDHTPSEARQAGAIVLNEPIPGYGRACLKGIDYVKARAQSNDIIVFMDGDYSDYPAELNELVRPIMEKGVDMVIGSRTLGEKETGAMNFQQIFGNWLATRLLWFIYKVKFTDLGPFRAIKFAKLLKLNMQDKTYGWTVEMQLKAAKQKLVCEEVPVRYRRRIGTSKISGTWKGTILAGYKILYTIFKYA